MLFDVSSSSVVTSFAIKIFVPVSGPAISKLNLLVSFVFICEPDIVSIFSFEAVRESKFSSL